MLKKVNFWPHLPWNCGCHGNSIHPPPPLSPILRSRIKLDSLLKTCYRSETKSKAIVTKVIRFFLFSDKPPDDPWQRKWYFKDKQKYVRYHRLYGNSLVGGINQAKSITVTETGDKKEKGKKTVRQLLVLTSYLLLQFPSSLYSTPDICNALLFPW